MVGFVDDILCVRITEFPKEGRANNAVLAFVVRAFEI
ncbi:hypothetical protein FIM12_08040 [SAR202 cluster bacterium AD-804-J14_MRT_500m]|nr:hypothetical protein [SAR202 cluster bacterium AD-804-J14_MRT_500m]